MLLKLPIFEGPETSASKPKTRGDCQKGGINAVRPCQHAWCRHHLDKSTSESCALDVADRGEHSLEEIAELFGLTRERIRQIEETAVFKLKKHRSVLDTFVRENN